ncbi:g8325 [Coccomyxa elongata]
MFGDFGHPQYAEYYDQVYSDPRPHHEAKWSHELLGGAAAFAAMRAYEQHQAANGRPPQHQMAKEILAGIVGAEVDKLVETKGMNEVDAMRARHHAKQEAERMFDQTYGREYGEQPYGGGGFGGPPPSGYGGPPYGGQPYGGAPYGGPQYGTPPPSGYGAPYGNQPYGAAPYGGQQYGGEYGRPY